MHLEHGAPEAKAMLGRRAFARSDIQSIMNWLVAMPDTPVLAPEDAPVILECIEQWADSGGEHRRVGLALEWLRIPSLTEEDILRLGRALFPEPTGVVTSSTWSKMVALGDESVLEVFIRASTHPAAGRLTWRFFSERMMPLPGAGWYAIALAKHPPARNEPSVVRMLEEYCYSNRPSDEVMFDILENLATGVSEEVVEQAVRMIRGSWAIQLKKWAEMGRGTKALGCLQALCWRQMGGPGMSKFRIETLRWIASDLDPIELETMAYHSMKWDGVERLSEWFPEALAAIRMRAPEFVVKLLSHDVAHIREAAIIALSNSEPPVYAPEPAPVAVHTARQGMSR